MEATLKKRVAERAIGRCALFRSRAHPELHKDHEKKHKK